MEECPVCGAPIDTGGKPDNLDFNGSFITAEWYIHCDCGACLTARCEYDWDGFTEVVED